MNGYVLTEEKLAAFEAYLRKEEHEKATIEKYIRNVQFFARWLEGKAVTKETVAAWKSFLQKEKYAPGTINAKLSSLNSFFCFAHLEKFRVKFLHIQRPMFREDSKDLLRAEYERLLRAARQTGDKRLELVMKTMGATGIRVSELAYITVEAARRGRTTIKLKGKIRVILLPEKLCRELLKYVKKCRIATGEIFLTKNGKSLSRRQIWREMKKLCRYAKVEDSKVYPHNLRHFFATMFYKATKDIVKLAEVLGHSSIGTTRIYLLTTGKEHARQISQLNLVI